MTAPPVQSSSTPPTSRNGWRRSSKNYGRWEFRLNFRRGCGIRSDRGNMRPFAPGTKFTSEEWLALGKLLFGQIIVVRGEQVLISRDNPKFICTFCSHTF